MGKRKDGTVSEPESGPVKVTLVGKKTGPLQSGGRSDRLEGRLKQFSETGCNAGIKTDKISDGCNGISESATEGKE